MNTETLDRLEALLAKASVKPLLLGANPYQDAADMRAHKRRIEELRREALNALPELLSIARRAADVEGMVAALYKDWPFRAISTALVEATGVALNETIPLQTFLDAGGDVNGLRKHATAISRYVMGETT